MEEKIIIKSERYEIKKVFKVMLIIGAVLSSIELIKLFRAHMKSYDYFYEKYGDRLGDNSTSLGYALSRTFEADNIIICLIPFATLALIGGLIYLWLRSYELTVTDKRIYGKVAFGKRVDLPVDSISAISTIRLLRGVSVSTASGRISFRIIKNADEIYKTMNNLLIERQQEKANAATVISHKGDEADQLKKYKDLLDSGAITQEEFDAKKRQLLGL